MKMMIGALAALVLACGLTAMSVADSDANVGKHFMILQETEQVEAPVPVEAPVQVEAPQPGELPVDSPSVLTDGVVIDQPVPEAAFESQCCPVSCVPCCCPPPAPTPTVFCLVDPCGCSHQACIRVPACCAGEQPVISWRKGIFRRQIATLCWSCCGHKAKVIVTCCGKVRVRD
jgi:hypothetical protein